MSGSAILASKTSPKDTLLHTTLIYFETHMTPNKEEEREHMTLKELERQDCQSTLNLVRMPRELNEKHAQRQQALKSCQGQPAALER